MISRKERKELKEFAKIIALGGVADLMNIPKERYDVTMYTIGGQQYTIDNMERGDLNALYACFKSRKRGYLTVSGSGQQSECMIDWAQVTIIRAVPASED